MDKLCKNCKWWELDTGDEEGMHWGSRHGIVDFVKLDFKIGDCKNPNLTYDHLPKNDNGLSYMDMECYSADLTTGENFGCIHFEEKEG